MFSAMALFCRRQLPLRTQEVQRVRWCERMSAMVSRRDAMTRGLLVVTTMPSATSLLQEATSLSAPSTSTTQMRHDPISLRSFR